MKVIRSVCLQENFDLNHLEGIDSLYLPGFVVPDPDGKTALCLAFENGHKNVSNVITLYYLIEEAVCLHL